MRECGHDICKAEICAIAARLQERMNAQKICPVYERISKHYTAQVLAEV